MSDGFVSFHVEGPHATLTIQRPEARNAMTFGMYDALVDACQRVDADPAVRTLTIRGTGGAFIAGTDISLFTTMTSGADGLAYEQRLEAVVDRLERVRATTIAAVDGAATGGGLLLAMACDLRVCTPRARFGMPIARTLGNALSGPNLTRMVDAFGAPGVRELLFTGRLLGPDDISQLGLVTRRAEVADLDSALQALRDHVCTLAPLTLQATKEGLRRVQAASRAAAPDTSDLVAACYGSADFRHGVRAFLAGVRPDFRGE